MNLPVMESVQSNGKTARTFVPLFKQHAHLNEIFTTETDCLTIINTNRRRVQDDTVRFKENIPPCFPAALRVSSPVSPTLDGPSPQEF